MWPQACGNAEGHVHRDEAGYQFHNRGLSICMCEWIFTLTIIIYYLAAPEDYLDISVNFTIPINQTDDLCANVTIETDNVLEDPELFLADLQSDTVEICDIRQAFVVISDSTRKKKN